MLTPSEDDPAFPTLSETQIERIRDFGTEQAIDAGDVLFSPADEAYDRLGRLVLRAHEGERGFLSEVAAPDVEDPVRVRMLERTFRQRLE